MRIFTADAREALLAWLAVRPRSHDRGVLPAASPTSAPRIHYASVEKVFKRWLTRIELLFSP